MTAKSLPRVAFLGTGLMGRPMAERLLAAGYELAVWNRTPSKTIGLVELGATIAPTAAAAVRDASIIIIMVTDGEAVGDILFAEPVLNALPTGALVIDMSSNAPEVARRHHDLLARRGIQHLDAPVSGGTLGAANGTLAIMVGGDRRDFDSAVSLLRHLGNPTAVGPSGSGQLAKLANQVIVAVTIGAVAEALLLAKAGGADPAAVREALRGGFAQSRILEEHGARMIDRAWTPGGPLRIQVKDLDAIERVAKSSSLKLPLLEAAHQLFASGLAAGLGDYDHSALLIELERLNPGQRVGDGSDLFVSPAL